MVIVIVILVNNVVFINNNMIGKYLILLNVMVNWIYVVVRIYF